MFRTLRLLIIVVAIARQDKHNHFCFKKATIAKLSPVRRCIKSAEHWYYNPDKRPPPQAKNVADVRQSESPILRSAATYMGKTNSKQTFYSTSETLPNPHGQATSPRLRRLLGYRYPHIAAGTAMWGFRIGVPLPRNNAATCGNQLRKEFCPPSKTNCLNPIKLCFHQAVVSCGKP